MDNKKLWVIPQPEKSSLVLRNEHKV